MRLEKLALERLFVFFPRCGPGDPDVKLDLSIGQRLTIGLLLLLFILVAVLVAVSRSHQASAKEQTVFTDHIAPLSDRAFALERSVYELGIAVRGYLLNQNEATRERYRRVVAATRDALRALHDVRKSTMGDVLYSDLAPLVYLYLLEADRVVEEGRAGINVGTERALASSRERAIEGIRAFSEYQAQQAQAALSGMALARKAVTRDLIVASVLALLFFVALAFLTAESIRRRTHNLLRIAHGFETGQWKAALTWAPDAQGSAQREPRNEMAQLARALGTAAAALERREQRLHADAEVAAATASSLKKEEIGRGVLLAIAQQVHAGAAVLYLLDAHSQSLDPLATYAFDGDVAPLRLGQGLAGEAARDVRTLVLHDIPSDTPWRIGLGFGRVSPKALAAVPVRFGPELLGVLLIASLQRFDDAVLTFLHAAAGQLGVGLRNALTHEDLQRVLAELRDKNQRIEAQNAQLQAQDEELQVQSEEIHTQNDQLREQAAELRAQIAHSLRREGAMRVQIVPDESA